MPELDQNSNDFSDNHNNNTEDNDLKIEDTNGPKVVTILHFNDCYNVEPRSQEPSGGAARFVTAINSFRDRQPIVLFSGDIIAPSIMSSITKGDQMIPVLNAMDIECALFGNHEFDFGVDHLKTFVSKTRFPWLMSNVTDPHTHHPIGGATSWHTVTRNGIKFGIIGLVEEQWVREFIDGDIIYEDFVSVGKKLAKHLKTELSCDLVIALTHMRWPNDTLLAKSQSPIDLILGGHDHDYERRLIDGIECVKSGTDFRQFSKIDIEFNGCRKERIKCQEISVNSSDFEEDPTLRQELKKFSTELESQMDRELAKMGAELDGRFSAVRSRETNLGNFVCDIVLTSFGPTADAVVLNSGTFRSDQLHSRGVFKLRDLIRILPMMDELVVLRLSGQQLLQTLECGVAHWPVLDGSYAQVSRIQFEFDPKRPVGQRVDPKSARIGGKPLDFDEYYRIVTKEFLHKGKDGYSVFKEAEVVLNSEQCLNLFTLVKNFFKPDDNLNTINANAVQKTPSSEKESRLLADIKAIERELRKFEPRVEGRVVCLQN